MLKIDNQQISFTDYLIPEELTVLDDELSIIDEYLNDDRDSTAVHRALPQEAWQALYSIAGILTDDVHQAHVFLQLRKYCSSEFPTVSNGEGSATYPWMLRFRMVRLFAN
ncbi:MAG: hypothetical protein ACOX27_06655 [Caldicoprobacterales bacterium]